MFDCTRLLRMVVFLLALSTAQMSSAQALTESQWVDLTDCKMPAKAPKKPKELDKTYNFQRQLLDLDRDGLCEVMDLWIERLGNSDSPGMRTLDHQFLVFRQGRWQPFWIDLRYFPYALRTRAAGEVMLIEAALADDIGDNMALGGQTVRVFKAPKWQPWVPVSVPQLSLTEIPSGLERAGVLQELAVVLTRRLMAGLPDPIRRGPGAAYRVQVETERIKWLLEVAHESLPASQWLPVDTEGLPTVRE